MGTRWGRMLSVFVIGVVVIASATVGSPDVVRAQDDPGAGAVNGIGSFEAAPCMLGLPDGTAEGEDVICGYVTVPVRHAQPEGDTLRLAVGVVKATGDDSAPDPLVIENGGPGVPSLISMPGMVGFPDFRQARDMVFIDQRGTGFSQPNLACEQGGELVQAWYGKNPDDADALALERDVQQQCYDQWIDQGVDLSAFNSLENAADIAMVMKALDYETYNFYGISYSSGLAQHLMRNHPEGLRSVVLDGVVTLHDHYTLSVPQSSQRAFDLLFDSCAADPVCSTQFPDLRATFYDLVARYNAEPVTHTFTNPWTGGTLQGVVTGQTLVLGLYQRIYDAGADPLLPASISALAAGDTHFLDHYVAPSRFGSLRMASGMSNAVICSEFAPDAITPLDSVHPAVAETMQWYLDYAPVCAVWQVERLPAATFDPVESAIPALVLSGEFDPVTPPESAEFVAAGLSNAFVYEFPGVGHGSMGSSGCGFQIVLDFVDDPTRAPDSACLDDLRVQFVESLDIITGITLVEVDVPEHHMRAPVPDSWLKVQPGLYVAPGQESFALVMRSASWDEALEGLQANQPSGSIESAGRVWTLYGAEFQGYVGTLALTVAQGADDQGGVLMVGLFSITADDLGSLTDAILLDMLYGVTAE